MYEGDTLKPVILLKSIGCRTNQEELVTLKGQLQSEGYSFTEDPAVAEIIVVNTCAVTAHTESKTRRLLQALAAQSPGAKICVTGCLAQQLPESLSSLNGIHWVVGNTLKQKIPELLSIAEGGVFHTCFTESDTDTDEQHLDMNVIAPSSTLRTRYSVKIQEGCNYRCAYCIVPQLRGPARSFNTPEILDLCRKSIEVGYKELILTGTHIGQFHDSQGGLLELLHRIDSLDGDFRVRLSSLDPRDCTDELLEMIGSHPRICNHLHISVQHFDPTVLERMGRGDTDSEKILKKLQAFRLKYPYAGIGADLIVGFPGETVEQFNTMVEMVKNVQFSYGHIFRFSERPGTRAEHFAGKISEKDKTDRSEQLREVIFNSRKAFINQCIGIPHRIIVESEKPVRGLTANYLHVELQETGTSYNSWLDVHIDGSENGRYCPAQPV